MKIIIDTFKHSDTQQRYLSLLAGSCDLGKELFLAGVSGELGQLLQDVGAGRGGDVNIVQQGGAVAGGTGEGVLL